jgi:gamma-glutamyl-gamma-aminobutyrate hydrolase PuuD
MNAPIPVGITQRVMALPERGERRDALDQAWMPFLQACGLEPVIIPNCHTCPQDFGTRMRIRGLILTGGNNVSNNITAIDGSPAKSLPEITKDLAPERDATEVALLRASIDNCWPVIAVCRGMQVLNLFHGGGLTPVTGHAGPRHAIAPKDAANWPPGFGLDAEVNSFHDFAIRESDVAPGLRVLATADGCAEAILHPNYRHLGIMWHPERNTPFSGHDLALFRRHFQ